MPPRLLSAERHAAQQAEVTRQTLRQVAALWGLIGVGDLDGGWAGVGPQIVAAVTAGQYRAAYLADSYVDDVTGEQGIDAPAVGAVDAGVFAASAADGRSLATLLREPIITAKVGIGEGLPVELARQRATNQLLMLSQVTVQDTGCAAVGAATVARPKLTGYVRMLTPPSCARCVILAGRVYRWSSWFPRHDRCDCRHIPTVENVAGDLTTDPRAYMDSMSAADRNRLLAKAAGKAAAQAYADGADLARLLNSRRSGLHVAGLYGQGEYLITTAGTTRRSVAGKRLADRYGTSKQGGRYEQANVPRLTPEAIYQIADDRDHAIRLLKLHGYVH